MNYSIVDFNAIFQRFRKYESEKSKLIELLKKEHEKAYPDKNHFCSDGVCQYLKELGE